MDQHPSACEGYPALLLALAADLQQLLALEARLFTRTVLLMLGMVVVLALLLGGAWLFIAGALAIALARLDALGQEGALLAVAVLHLALAALVVWRLRQQAQDLSFRESRSAIRHLLTQAQPGARGDGAKVASA